jgi:hypothetical protein
MEGITQLGFWNPTDFQQFTIREQFRELFRSALMVHVFDPESNLAKFMLNGPECEWHQDVGKDAQSGKNVVYEGDVIFWSNNSSTWLRHKDYDEIYKPLLGELIRFNNALFKHRVNPNMPVDRWFVRAVL